jgi:hypothetical protein
MLRGLSVFFGRGRMDDGDLDLNLEFIAFAFVES